MERRQADTGIGRGRSIGQRYDTYAGRDTNEAGKKQPGGDKQHPQHRSVSPSHLGPQGGSTADSGKAKHDQAAQAEQDAAKSSTPAKSVASYEPGGHGRQARQRVPFTFTMKRECQFCDDLAYCVTRR